MTRALALLALMLALPACGWLGMSAEQEQQLAGYQSNAKLYWEGGRIDQALDQVRRGLEIDPEDYRLRVIRAWCYLRMSQDEPRQLEAAVTEFDQVMELRADGDHAPQARLGYARAHATTALRLVGRARDRRDALARLALDGEAKAARATEIEQLEAEARAHFDLAEAQLQRLLAAGESLLLAHYDLMTVKWWRDDYEGAVAEAHAYLGRAADMQARIRGDLERTTSIAFERERRTELQRYIDDEVGVRAFLANMHYKKQHYDLAVEQLDRVLAQNPGLYFEYYNRGRSLLALGRRDDAKRDLEKFLSTTDLPHDSQQVRESLRALREMK